MKTTLVFSLASVAALLAVQSLEAQTTLADWTFETSASTNSIIGAGLTPGTTQSGVLADLGTGTASASHAASATAWSIPAGNGSSHSWSANNWAQGDFIQFAATLDLVNDTYSGFNVSYDQNGSATGPKTFYLAYSTDGSTFTQFGADYALTSGITWAAGTANQGTQASDNLSAITALNTASVVYFRIVDDSPTTGGAINGGNVGTAGSDRIDNFVISALVNPVPEPTTMALAGLGALSLMLFRRQRQ